MDEETKALIKSIYEQNNEIKEDVKTIKQELSNYAIKIQTLESTVTTLKAENLELKNEIETIRRRSKDNGLIIFGVKEEQNILTIDVVKKIIKDKLDIDLENIDINNTYRIGKTNSEDSIRPIILELGRNYKKQEILQNCKKLKGTGIAISHDLTAIEREQKQLLYKHYKQAKQKNYNATLHRNKLIINGETYSYEDLKNDNGDNVIDKAATQSSSNKRKDALTPPELHRKKLPEV